MGIIRAILAGERNPAVLANLPDLRCHSGSEMLESALTGHYRAEHLFALEQALVLYDTSSTTLCAMAWITPTPKRPIMRNGTTSG
jgi:hypothetical protein